MEHTLALVKDNTFLLKLSWIATDLASFERFKVRFDGSTNKSALCRIVRPCIQLVLILTMISCYRLKGLRHPIFDYNMDFVRRNTHSNTDSNTQINSGPVTTATITVH